MTNNELIKAGYTRWEPSPYESCVTDLFEKCIKDERGKKYFIHIKRWDFSKYERPGYETGARYEATVQLTHKNGECVDVTCLNGWVLKDIEKYYEDI